MDDDYPQMDREPDESGHGEAEDMETTLIPKSMLMGKKFDVGDEVVLKIVHDHGDEIEVEYATGKDEKEKPEKEGGSEMSKADSKLSAMAY